MLDLKVIMTIFYMFLKNTFLEWLAVCIQNLRGPKAHYIKIFGDVLYVKNIKLTLFEVFLPLQELIFILMQLCLSKILVWCEIWSK